MEPSEREEWAAAQKVIVGVRSLFEFARARVFQQMSRLLVQTNEQELRDDFLELRSTLDLYVRIRKLAVRAIQLENPCLKVRRGEGLELDYDQPDEGLHVERYEVKPGKASVLLELVSPLGFNVRLVIPPNVSARMRESLRLAESKCSPSEENRR